MAVSLKSTKNVTLNGVKMLAYGNAGAGETTLIRTMPAPVILSAEGGLLSLQDSDIPYISVSSIADIGEAYEWLLKSEESRKFKSVALDSISEIAEVVLSEEKKNTKDARAAYGSMNDRMSQLIRAFRDLPGRHVYFSAKIEKSTTDADALLYCPSMPGKSLTQALPYFFDEVLALRLIQDDEGNVRRVLQCHGDLSYQAKDRSGRLSAYEPADLGTIIAKIAGERNGD